MFKVPMQLNYCINFRTFPCSGDVSVCIMTLHARTYPYCVRYQGAATQPEMHRLFKWILIHAVIYQISRIHRNH